MKDSCGTCRFFRERDILTVEGIGHCCFNAPALVAGTLNVFPRMHESQWCREHAPSDEELQRQYEVQKALICCCGHTHGEHNTVEFDYKSGHTKNPCSKCGCSTFRDQMAP